MGRAMLIIVSGFIVASGFILNGIRSQTSMVTKSNAHYASDAQAKNLAHTGVQIALMEMNEDPKEWINTYNNEESAQTYNIEDGSSKVYAKLESTYDDGNPKRIRVYSEGNYLNRSSNVIILFQRNKFDEFVPDFKSAVSFATELFNFSLDGNASINGNAQSEACEDRPAVTVQSDVKKQEIINEGNYKETNLTGNPPIGVDQDLHYSPVDSMIARLKEAPHTDISGNYKGSVGSASEPGVFFVEDYAKLSGGIKEGYGILVVRTDGKMQYEDESGALLDLKGNFKFNGLVIFENAYALDGGGTPEVSGSVLVGTTEDYEQGHMNFENTGNLSIQYDCQAKKYADQAAVNAVNQFRFKRVSTYE